MEPEWGRFHQVPGQIIEPDGVAGTFWENSRYQVVRRDYADGRLGSYVHLTIRSLDGSARHGWRDFQRIKNELVSAEAEGVELYPAESRLVDTATHLWVFTEHRFPLGMMEREVSDAAPGLSQRAHA
jgi:hypothetical protein